MRGSRVGDGLLLSFYGDDLTGSTAVLEALAKNGVKTALFFNPPDPEELTGWFSDLRAIGVAGRSRSMTPAEMNEHLGPVFDDLSRLDSPITHYKVCSTFDSSPEVGNIGHAIDLAQRRFRSPFVPVVVGNPPLEPLGRYVVFGNLFATHGDEIYRLDRHPTMRIHPVTPMDDSDLRRHLGDQTEAAIGLVDVRDLEEDPAAGLRRERESSEIILFDTLANRHLSAIGRVLNEQGSTTNPLFVVGSSAVEYALIDTWRTDGRISGSGSVSSIKPTDRLLVMSGSAAPITESQLQYAEAAGFRSIRLDSLALIDPDTAAPARNSAIQSAVDALNSGQSVVIFSAMGPDDPAIRRTNAMAEDIGTSAGKRLGYEQGRIVKRILESTAVGRICVAGGDTSGAVADRLGIRALVRLASIAPGNPLCLTIADEESVDGLQIVFKGGQVGGQAYFEDVRRGNSNSDNDRSDGEGEDND